MNLQQLNEKYHGKPIELGAWKHPMFGTPPNMGFSIEAKFSDGKFYNLRATLVVEAMELPRSCQWTRAARFAAASCADGTCHLVGESVMDSFAVLGRSPQ